MIEPQLLKLDEMTELVIDKKLELPDIQRGFVWKPHQIEYLWDSILRGFPAGSLIVHEKPPDSLQLLDGQKRTTSIALAFGNNALRRPTDDIRLFIDLLKPNIEKTRRYYAVRVITKSHPWGYKFNDNTQLLESGKKI